MADAAGLQPKGLPEERILTTAQYRADQTGAPHLGFPAGDGTAPSAGQTAWLEQKLAEIPGCGKTGPRPHERTAAAAIPQKPQYKSVDALADALDKSVGCDRRKTESADQALCETQAAKTHPRSRSGDGRDAHLTLHDSSAARNDYIRLLLSDDHVPYYIATAGNWTIQLCDTATGQEAARDLGGVVVDHRANK
ncbi:hypothetical protein ACFWD7_00330 [Streptomyces mirabilis]|uniref:hypothetical protein n=1 Tax=Streptomyces mirabilis TaxID=68239 RepID=UPI0036A8D6EE